MEPRSFLNDPRHWRERAEEARSRADQIAEPQSKNAMLRQGTAGERRRGDGRKSAMNPVCASDIERVRARLDALVRANAAPRCGARSKRTGKPCRAAAMPNGRCKVHGGKSTGPRTPEGLERSKRERWKHGYYSREAKAERSRVRAAILALRYLRMLGQ